MMCHLANALYKTRACSWITQDNFFCCLAGPVAPTGNLKAIVHWVRSINAIKVEPVTDWPPAQWKQHLHSTIVIRNRQIRKSA